MPTINLLNTLIKILKIYITYLIIKKTNDYSFNFFVQHYTIKNEYFIPNAFVWNHTDCPQLWDRLTNKEKYLRYD